MPPRDTITEEGSVKIARHSGFRRASHRHQTLASTPAPVARNLSTCTCSLGHIRCHHSEKKILNAKWVQQPWLISYTQHLQHHPPTMTAGSLASPLETEGVPQLYPWSFVKAPQFGPTSRWHTQSSDCALETKNEMSDLPVVIRVFAQDCAQMHVWVIPSASQWVVNDLPPTPNPLFHKRAVVLNARNGEFGITSTFDDSARFESVVPLHSQYIRYGFLYWDSRFRCKTISALGLKVWIMRISKYNKQIIKIKREKEREKTNGGEEEGTEKERKKRNRRKV